MEKEVSKGLAEVCLMLAKSTENNHYKKQFEKYARVFDAFGKINNQEVKAMVKPINKEEEKERTKCISDLNKLEKEYGTLIFRRACNRKLTIDRQTSQRERDIKKAERELQQLKSGKPLPQY